MIDDLLHYAAARSCSTPLAPPRLFLFTARAPSSPLFPYTTLFRSIDPVLRTTGDDVLGIGHAPRRADDAEILRFLERRGLRWRGERGRERGEIGRAHV